MSAYKTIELTRTGDGSLVFDSVVTRWRMDAFPANAQVSVANLGAGSFDVAIRPAGHLEFKEHINGATEDDLVMISGKEAPLFSAIRVTASGTGGAEIKAFLTLWERGI
jgi:hypothetical protein